MSTNTPNPFSSEDELREQIKDTALRPLADKFQELTRQIDSGKYDLPKTIEEAVTITESYIEQASERIERLFQKELSRSTAQISLEARVDEITYRNPIPIDPDTSAWGEGYNDHAKHMEQLRKVRIAELQAQLKETHDE